jgi:hypothetical protein
MRPSRRQFLSVGAIAAAAAAASRCTPQPSQQAPTGASNIVASPFSLSLQFAGLMVHGSWPAQDATKPNVLSGWDALLVRDGGAHKGQLRLPLANVNNPSGYTPDRYNPGIGVWDLTNMDVLIRVDNAARGEVTTTTGKRRTDASGKPVPCPDFTKDDEYTDITWLNRISDVFGAGAGAIQDSLKGDANSIAKDSLLNARVRLPKGSISCVRPSRANYDRIMFKFKDITAYSQFLTDIVRFKSNDAQAIQLELVPFGASSGTTIDLTATGGTIAAYVENVDPLLGDKVLNGVIKKADFFMHHFEPYFKIVKYAGVKRYPAPQLCPDVGIAGDPPFYCISTGGEL